MAAKINVNDFDKIAAELQALKAAAEAEVLKRPGRSMSLLVMDTMVPALALTTTRIPVSSPWLRATSPMRTAGLLREMP